MSNRPKFIHDTRRIVSVNPEGCALFRCDESALVDLDMMELVVHEDFKGLARLRMRVLRERRRIKPYQYLYRRCDGSMFWAAVVTVHLDGDQFETTLIYLGERT